MKYWEFFWTLCLVVAGSAFAFITLIVIVRGGPDLREMLRHLRRQNLQTDSQSTPARLYR